MIRGVENIDNNKKFKCSVHTVLEKAVRKQQSSKEAFLCIRGIIKKRSSVVFMLVDLICPKRNTDYVFRITRMLPAHYKSLSRLVFATKGLGHLAAPYLLLLLVTRYKLPYHKTICYL